MSKSCRFIDFLLCLCYNEDINTEPERSIIWDRIGRLGKSIGNLALAVAMSAGCGNQTTTQASFSETALVQPVNIGDDMNSIIKNTCNTANEQKVLDATVQLAQYNGAVNPSFNDSRASLMAGEKIYIPIDFCNKAINRKIPVMDPNDPNLLSDFVDTKGDKTGHETKLPFGE